MPKGDDVGRLADPDSFRTSRQIGAHHHRVRADLQALVAEVVFGVPDRVPACAVAVLGDVAAFGDHPVKRLLEAEVVLVEEVAEVHR